MLRKISAGLASGALLATMLAGTAFADGSGITCSITDNGALSHNRCKIVTVNKTKTVQVNNAWVSNSVYVKSSTGGNDANKNNGGDVTVTTGDSNVTVKITNNVNANVIGP